MRIRFLETTMVYLFISRSLHSKALQAEVSFLKFVVEPNVEGVLHISKIKYSAY
jgi:hypothetical protein